MSMNSNSVVSLLSYGEDMESKIEAVCVTHVEDGDVHDRSCAVSKIEKSASEAVVADSNNDATKVNEPDISRDEPLASREQMFVDHFLSFGHYSYAPRCFGRTSKLLIISGLCNDAVWLPQGA